MPDVDLISASKAFFKHAFDGVVRIELIDEPVAVWVDGRVDPPQVSEQSPTGVDGQFCLWRIDPLDVPLVLVPDAKRFENGFIAGRILVSGDMSIMMRIDLSDG